MFTQTPKTTNNHDISEKQHDKTKTVTHNTDQRGLLPGLSLTQENILQLQRTIGNSAVMQLLKYHLQQPPACPPIQRVESEENEVDMLPDDAIQMAGDLEDEEEIQMKQDNITIQRTEIEDEDEIQMKNDHTIENNTGMPNNLKAGLETLSGLDLSEVHVHSNSDKPANVGALAYTQGTDIYIAPGQEKHLPHEGWHVVQQKQGRVQTTTQVAGMPVNDDPQLEKEADTMGDRALTSISSVPTIIQQKKFAQTSETVQFVKYTSTKSQISMGVFEADLNPGIYALLDPNAYGMNTSITFTPDQNAPDMKIIKLVQAVKTQKPSGQDIVWKGDEARREKTKTDAGIGITPGFFIDQKASKFSPREDKIKGNQDIEVPSAYMEQFTQQGKQYHGNKIGNSIKHAEMEDFPSSVKPHIFSAETIAQAEMTGGNTTTVGRCDWGFETELLGGTKWNIKNSHVNFHDVDSDTFKAALNKFNDVYRNPESKLSPEYVNKLIKDYKATQVTQEQDRIKDELRQIVIELDKNADPGKDPGHRLKMILNLRDQIII